MALTWQNQQFNAALAEVVRRSHRESSELVVLWSRRLVQKAAIRTPITRVRAENRGRARAGWWPAILALGGGSAYTPAPNKGEGSIRFTGMGTDQPSIFLENAVPYITRLKVGTGWFDSAIEEVRARMVADMETSYQRVVSV